MQPSTSPPSSPQLSCLCQHHVGPPLDQQRYLSRTLDCLLQVMQFIVAMTQMCWFIAYCNPVCVTCVKVVVLSSAATAEASVSGMKRSPADESTLSTRDAVDETSPEGIVHWVVRLILVGLFGIRLCSESVVWTSTHWLPIAVRQDASQADGVEVKLRR